MPGYVIHLAVAEKYLKKHKCKNEDYNEFIEGIIYPDSTKIKSETHYGEKSSESNIYEFLKEHELNNSFERGYFLHLLTDYLFYNRYIDTISNEIYSDYDILNDKLIEKYNVKLPDKVKHTVSSKDGCLVILSMEIIDKLIDDISNYDLEELALDVKKDPLKWTRMRKLKRL